MGLGKEYDVNTILLTTMIRKDTAPYNSALNSFMKATDFSMLFELYVCTRCQVPQLAENPEELFEIRDFLRAHRAAAAATSVVLEKVSITWSGSEARCPASVAAVCNCGRLLDQYRPVASRKQHLFG